MGDRSWRFVAALALVLAAAACLLTAYLFVRQAELITHNRGAIIRSCDILNDAIASSQQQSGRSEVFTLFATYVFDTPEKQAALRRAVAADSESPGLPQIDCRRVAANPDYHPFDP